jgi:hypothetical protein
MGHIQRWRNMVALTIETLWATMEWASRSKFAKPIRRTLFPVDNMFSFKDIH